MSSLCSNKLQFRQTTNSWQHSKLQQATASCLLFTKDCTVRLEAGVVCFHSSTRGGSGWSCVSIRLLICASQVPDQVNLIPNHGLAIQITVPLPQSMGVVFESQHSMTICWLSESRPCWLGACTQVSVVRRDGAEPPGLVLGDCHVGQGAVTRLVSKGLVCSAHIEAVRQALCRGSCNKHDNFMGINTHRVLRQDFPALCLPYNHDADE